MKKPSKTPPIQSLNPSRPVPIFPWLTHDLLVPSGVAVDGQILHHFETMVETITFVGIYVGESNHSEWFLSSVRDRGFRVAIHSLNPQRRNPRTSGLEPEEVPSEVRRESAELFARQLGGPWPAPRSQTARAGNSYGAKRLPSFES